MKKIVLFFSLILFSFSIKAQSLTDLNSQLKLTYNIVGLNFGYETAISKKTTFELSAGLGAGNYVRNNAFIDKEFGASLSLQKFPPFRLRSHFKHIYNREKRLKNNKPLINNSGNYIGLLTTFTTAQNTNEIKNPPNNVILNEIHWGLQRTLGKKWIIDFNLGVGYAVDLDTDLSTFYPALGLSLSYKIF